MLVAMVKCANLSLFVNFLLFNKLICPQSFYIALLILINVSAHYATNLYPVEETSRIFADPKEVADRIFGSKIVVGLEQSMMAVTWLVKLCIWFFLKRVW